MNAKFSSARHRNLSATSSAWLDRRDSALDQNMTRTEADQAIVIKPIGVVRSRLRDPREAPNQAFEGAPEASLEITPDLAPALHRVFPGAELIVVTWLHAADRTTLQTHPMDDEGIPLTGVFATRSPGRPNPIGLHRITVTGFGSPTSIHVDALEAIDGTPILDLKVAMTHAPDA